MRRAAPRLIATLALALLLAACPGPSSDTVQTSIAFFDASATSVERGDPVTLSWQVDNPGTAPDQDPPVFPCSITRRPENADPENFQVACTGTLEETPPVPATSSFIRYQLNALKRPFDAASPYITQTITINLGQPATGDTAIARFEADATNIERGDPVTLTWQVINPGSAAGAPSCSVSRRAENEPAEDPFEVACSSTLTEIPPAPATSNFIRYQLNALKRPFDAVDPYLTSIITINLSQPATGDTAIARFEADATSIVRGDPVALSWQVDNPGTAPGVASCRLTRQAENEPAEEPFPVACTSTLNDTPSVPVTSSSISYRLDALKNPPDAVDPYLTNIITIDIEDTTYATPAGGVGFDEGLDVSTLGDGSAIVTGSFQGSATFGDTTLTSAGNTDVFVARINPNGTWAWVAQAGGTSSARGLGVSALPDGSAIVTGEFAGIAEFGDIALTSVGSTDAFVARIDADGTWAWATPAGGVNADVARDVSALSDGSAVVAGFFAGAATFGGTTLTSAGPTNGARDDVFVARIDANGTWVWAARGGAPESDVAWSVSTLDDGGAIVTGSFQGSATFGGSSLTGAGADDVFVARIDADGNWLWATEAVGLGFVSAWGVSRLSDDGAIVSGYFSGDASFGGTTLTSVGGSDAFVARIDASGAWVWAAQAGGGNTDEAWDVTALADGSAIVTGTFAGTAAFDGIDITSVGSGDVFVARIDPNGTWIWATRAGGPLFDSGWGVSALDDGSTIITGAYADTATFGSTTLLGAGSGDVFVAKIDAQGAW